MLIHNLRYPRGYKSDSVKKTPKIKPLLFENMLKALIKALID